MHKKEIPSLGIMIFLIISFMVILYGCASGLFLQEYHDAQVRHAEAQKAANTTDHYGR